MAGKKSTWQCHQYNASERDSFLNHYGTDVQYANTRLYDSRHVGIGSYVVLSDSEVDNLFADVFGCMQMGSALTLCSDVDALAGDVSKNASDCGTTCSMLGLSLSISCASCNHNVSQQPIEHGH